MPIPAIRGTIDRRILVNYHVDPDVLAGILPAPFRPQIVAGKGIAGVCLIRLSRVRPPLVPRSVGMTSENAAHRVAVEWDENGATRQGVWIPRRDTSSRLTALFGGRLFPGLQHHARFKVDEQEDRYSIAVDSDDGKTHILVDARLSQKLPSGTVFSSLREASDFFERGSVGYSNRTRPGTFDGMELRTASWKVQPLETSRVESSFFENAGLFPPGAAEFDCALLMQKVEHEWRERPVLCAASANA
jgi:hypothetical protein